MRTRTRLALVLVVCAATASLALGQMTAQYDSYTTYAVDENFVVYQRVVVHGTTVGGCTITYTYWDGGAWRTGYSEVPGCRTAVHTPTITNIIDGAGGTTSGAAVNPFDPLWFETTTTYQATQGQFLSGALIATTTEAKVTCTAAGVIFILALARLVQLLPDMTVEPACPPSVALASMTPYDLADYYPSKKTGMGAVAEMHVGSDFDNWNGSQVTEAVSLRSKTCPDSFNVTFCVGSSTWTVGTGAHFVDRDFAAKQNTFYDGHFTATADNKLVSTNTQSCQVICDQTYSCGGNVIGRFTITRNFTRRNIQGEIVSNLAVSKAAQ